MKVKAVVWWETVGMDGRESIGDGGGGVDEREEGGVGGRESIGDRGVA